jgi:hypothetical protein
MKNRDENTTLNQFSYRSFTIFESFFYYFILENVQKKAPLLKEALLNEV